MVITILIISVVVLAIGFLGILLFIWYQYNATDSKLYKIIDNRIEKEKVSSEQDHIESIDDLEEAEDIE